MKNFNREFVQKFIGQDESLRYAYPFPGKHPLRVWWKAGELEYLGKFTHQAWSRYNRLGFRGEYVIFDRAGFIVGRAPEWGGVFFANVTRVFRYFGRTSPPPPILGANVFFEAQKHGNYWLYVNPESVSTGAVDLWALGAVGVNINQYLITMQSIERDRIQHEAAV